MICDNCEAEKTFQCSDAVGWETGL